MEHHFQVVVLGTGLIESIAAAALSKAGYTVAHLDPNAYYGADEASLSPDELIQWATERSTDSRSAATPYLTAQRARYTNILFSSTPPPHAKHYALSLAPSIVPSVGPMIDSLVASGVARYGGYKLVERIAVYDASGTLSAVPGSKEDVFRSRELSLIDKRRLMRFLMFAAGSFEDTPELSGKADVPFTEFLASTFSLPRKVVDALAYALAFCYTATEPTLAALQRIRNTLRSAGRYGPSPFLIGHYGGAGEIAQGFCRTSAVQGGIYVLGRPIVSVKPHPASAAEDANAPLGSFGVRIHEFPDMMTSDLILASPDLLTDDLKSRAKQVAAPTTSIGAQPTSVARAVVTLDYPIAFGAAPIPAEEGSAEDDTDTAVDTGVIVFPPSSLAGGSSNVAVTALVTGEGSMSTPRGKRIVYISLPLFSSPSASAEALLKPYLDALLASSMSTTLEQQTSETGEQTSNAEHDQSSTGLQAPTFSIFYTEDLSSPLQADALHEATTPKVLVSPPRISRLPEAADGAATQGKALFWAAVKDLEAHGIRPSNAGSDGDEVDVTAFWPPIEKDDDDEGW